MLCVNNIFVFTSSTSCMMQGIDLSNGTSLRDTDQLSRIFFNNFCVFYFRNKNLLTEFKVLHIDFQKCFGFLAKYMRYLVAHLSSLIKRKTSATADFIFYIHSPTKCTIQSH